MLIHVLAMRTSWSSAGNLARAHQPGHRAQPGADPAWSRCATHHRLSFYDGRVLTLARLAGAQKFTEEALEFQERISQKNGLSYKETYLPGSLHLEPPEVNMEAARAEARMVLFGAVQEVLDRTGARAPGFRTCAQCASCMHVPDEHHGCPHARAQSPARAQARLIFSCQHHSSTL